MVKIYEADHITDAHLVRGALEQAGIDVWIQGEYLQGGIGELGVAGLITLHVNPTDEDRAKEFIDTLKDTVFEDMPTDEADVNGSYPLTTVAKSYVFDRRPTMLILIALAAAMLAFIAYQLLLLLWMP